MPICENRKLAFCHIPRTGGVSVCNALQLKIVDKHFPASWYRKNYPNYFLFTIVRNYEDRIKSTFGWKNDPLYKKDSLDELVQHVKQRGGDNIGLMLKPEEYFLDEPVDYKIRIRKSELNKM